MSFLGHACFEKLFLCFKGVATSFVAGASGAVANFNHTCGAGVCGCVVNTVFNAAMNTAFGFTTIIHFLQFLSGY